MAAFSLTPSHPHLTNQKRRFSLGRVSGGGQQTAARTGPAGVDFLVSLCGPCADASTVKVEDSLFYIIFPTQPHSALGLVCAQLNFLVLCRRYLHLSS